MSHDPWMEDSNSLDLTEGLEDRVHVPFVCTRDHAEWLTADGQASFARGTEASVEQSQEEAYAAMAMKDTLSSPFGLDSACPTLGLSDVRAQPPKKDDGYPTLETEGDLPDTTAIIRTLMTHRDLIMNNQMIYLIVDNRMPAEVPHWPAFAAWWASRRCLVGPQEETTDILWVCADATTGLHKVPYYWAGVFVLEAARFLYPAQHFALIDNDCVPVTLFEVQDLLQLAHQQHQWVDLLGRARSESSSCAGIGMLFFTEAMMRLLRPWRRASRRAALPWYLEPDHQSIRAIQSSVALCLPLLLVSQCKPPLTSVWSGPYTGFTCVSTFGLALLSPRMNLVQAAQSSGHGNPIPGPSPLQEESELRGSLAGLAPPLNSEYFQCFQCLLGHAQSRRCQVVFQASALPRNRMRPAIFHAFGKAKVGTQAALRELEQQGWETLPIAILGMPNLPPRMGCGDLETNRRVQIHRLFLWGSREQCLALLPALKVAGDSSASDRTLSSTTAGGQP